MPTEQGGQDADKSENGKEDKSLLYPPHLLFVACQVVLKHEPPATYTGQMDLLHLAFDCTRKVGKVAPIHNLISSLSLTVVESLKKRNH